MASDITDKALMEATLRLAWYAKTYGGIPPHEMAKLMRAGHGLRVDDHSRELLRDARDLKEYLLSIVS